MRKAVALIVAFWLFAMADAAMAQQFGPFGSAMSGPSSSGTASSFFSRTMSRPDVVSPMSFRPAVPAPLNFNILNMMPTLPSLADTLSLRNVFGSKPQMGYVLPKQATPPPKKSPPPKK